MGLSDKMMHQAFVITDDVVTFVTAHRMIAVKSSQQNVSFEPDLTADFDTATL